MAFMGATAKNTQKEKDMDKEMGVPVARARATGMPVGRAKELQRSIGALLHKLLAAAPRLKAVLIPVAKGRDTSISRTTR